jgi:uncharacterized cupredoxin-like copper-binding protein
MTKTSMAVVGLVLLGAVASSAAWAMSMSTINVSLTGEGAGKMAIAADTVEVAAGRVTFVVKNDAIGEDHEMLVVKVASADAELPYDAAKDRVIEAKVKKLGEVSDLKPGTTKSMTLDLTPGTYKLICNTKGHYMAGMSAVLTVAK